MAGIGWKWLETAGNGWKWLEYDMVSAVLALGLVLYMTGFDNYDESNVMACITVLTVSRHAIEEFGSDCFALFLNSFDLGCTIG